MTGKTSETIARVKNPKGGNPKIVPTDEQIEAALRMNAGLRTAAARALKISRATLYRRMQENPHLYDVCREIDEEVIDLSEGVVLQAIKAGDVATARWHLETKGKDRGYSRQVGVTGRDGGPLLVESRIDMSKLSDEALREIAFAQIEDDDQAQ